MKMDAFWAIQQNEPHQLKKKIMLYVNFHLLIMQFKKKAEETQSKPRK